MVARTDFELFDLSTHENKTKIGKYEFPFTIQTSKNMKPSFLVF